jgi:transposase-like protein
MNQEKRKLKIYSAEFRASSVKLAIDSDLPIAQTAKDWVRLNKRHQSSIGFFPTPQLAWL